MGDPENWNSSSYDMDGTEFSGYNGYAVTGSETSSPTGGTDGFEIANVMGAGTRGPMAFL